MVREGFGPTLAALRAARGWSQTELATRLGLQSHAHISNLEAGRKAPSLDLLLRIAAVFEVPLATLLPERDPPEGTARPSGTGQLRERSVAYQVRGASDPQAMAHVGPTLRRLRQRAGVTQSALAEALGLRSHVFVSRLETGQKAPSIALLMRIAAYFQMRLERLL